MSIQIDWDRLLEDADKVETKLKEFLDDQFQRANLPPFIQSLSVSSFKLGGIPPEITIRHLADPFPEFYEEYDSSDETDGEHENGQAPGSPTPARDSTATVEDVNFSRLMSPGREPPTKPFGRSSTPSGSLNYFHSNSTPDSSLFANGEALHDLEENQASIASFNETHNVSPLDTQLFVEFKYAGDTQLGITATLLVNFPAPGFVSLPLEFKITGVEIHSLAVIAYVKNRVYLSILCDVDDNDQMSVEDVKVIKQLNMESKIGDHGDNGAVLRNVSKVEQFILEQLRKVLRDELVWPGWITLEL